MLRKKKKWKCRAEARRPWCFGERRVRHENDSTEFNKESKRGKNWNVEREEERLFSERPSSKREEWLKGEKQEWKS